MRKSDRLILEAFVSDGQLQNIAIEYGDRKITYAGLLSAVQTRAQEISHVVSEGEVVSLQKGRSVEYVVDLLATLQLGAIVMPIDPSYPEVRRKDMLDIVPAQATVSDHSEVARLGAQNIVPSFGNSPARPGYIMFTSGSTGRPKAILGAVSALLNFIRWQGEEFSVSAGDRVSFLTPVGFDVSFRDILLPLLHGATLVIPRPEDIASPLRIANWLENQEITIAHAVPSVAKVWARASTTPKTSLRLCFLAGEKLYPALVEELRATFGDHIEYVNLYGPSETTLAKFFHRVGAIPEGSTAPIAVGNPIPGTRFSFLGNEQSGEVVITTDDASLGYIGAADEQQARFSLDEFGKTCYRTGDVGETLETGELVIVGRADDEVKVNGVRVHPNEVTQTLSAFSGAKDVVVISTTPENTSDPRLAVFWTPAYISPPSDEGAFRSFALAQLPRAIVPTIWRDLEELPQGPNGKVDVRALRQILAKSAATARAPVTETEIWLAERVGEILDLAVDNVEADLFGLGGTSIHIALMIGKIEAELGKILDFADIFAASTLTRIASLIDASKQHEPVVIPELKPAEKYKMSPQQRRWWNIYMPRGNRSWATMVRLITFEDGLTDRQLRNALCTLIDRQDSLRLIFDEDGAEISLKEPVDVDFRDFPIPTVDHSDLSVDDAAKALDEARLKTANSEIRTDQWPLFRVSIVHLPSGRSTLIFAMHHMISDGFSMNLMEAQIRNLVSDTPKPLAPLQYNYLAYADWARDVEDCQYGEGSDAQKYWGTVFETPYQKHIFPEKWTGLDHDRGQGYCIKVPEQLRAATQNFARENRVTEFSVYFSAKLKALHRLTNRDDLVVGTPAAGREVKGSEELVGNFISLVCIRSKDPNSTPALHYVRSTMRAVAQAMTHQNYQYDKLVDKLGMEYEQDRFPLTTMFISYLNFIGAGGSNFDESEVGFLDLGFAVKFDLMSYVREHHQATSLLIQYRNNLFAQEDISQFADTWISELQAIVLTQ